METALLRGEVQLAEQMERGDPDAERRAREAEVLRAESAEVAEMPRASAQERAKKGQRVK